MPPNSCRPDEELVPLLTDDPSDEELRRHVDGCAFCRERLERLRSEVTSLRDLFSDHETLPLSRRGPKPADRPAVIGKYLIVGTLELGLATLYRAINPDLNVEVAIRLGPRADMGDPSQFLNQGRLLSTLKHPNLEQVYDVGQHEGQPFLVMEFVRGPNLTRSTAEKKLDARQAAVLVAKLARALSVAHAQKIYHLDVKPCKILVDTAGEPRLTRFRLAKISGGTIGTPAYMAPEQARGETESIGARTDLYGLGGVLYFLLIGRPPREIAEPAEIIERARCGDIDRAALRRAPKALVAICLKALETDPAKRYTSADEMADALERFARPRIRGWILLAIAAAIAAGLVWVLWPAGR
jgi:serine/threonine protein kinase